MWTNIKGVLLELAGSKKFLLIVATLIAWAAARLGLQIEQAQIDRFLELMGTLILAQGVADHGKPAAEKTAQLAAAVALEPGTHREAALRVLAKVANENDARDVAA